VDSAIETHKGEVRKDVEVYLGDRDADREYKLEAQKRLYEAVGPLRFQLQVASREFADRVSSHVERGGYSTRLHGYDGYYGRSMLYRLLRPLAIATMIERQISFADFSVDPSIVKLLFFRRAAYMALTDKATILDDKRANWNEEREHVVSNTLTNAASLIILEVNDKERVQYFKEFEDMFEDGGNWQDLSPLPEIFEDFTVTRKPLFWIRLTCLAYLCNEFVRAEGRNLGFEERTIDVQGMLRATKDSQIISQLATYEEAFRTISNTRL